MPVDDLGRAAAPLATATIRA